MKVLFCHQNRCLAGFKLGMIRTHQGRKIKMAILDVRSLQKTYTTRFGTNQVTALSDVNFSVEDGEYVAIMGE